MAYSDKEILKIYEDMELELIERMKKHLTKMKLDGVSKSEIDRWTASQMRQLEKFRRESALMINRYNKVITKETEKSLLAQYQKSREKEFNRLVRNYGKDKRLQTALAGISVNEIKGLDDRRMAAFLSAVMHDQSKAMSSVFRKVNDQYREIIFDSAAKFNAGTVSLTKAVDEAQRDFLKNGITSITYKNGNEVNIRSYSEMALRTNGNRAAIQGAATLRSQVGISYVRVSHHGITCPLCAEWSGSVLIDDVYADGKPDGIHDMLSDAIAAGLLHPNCRCTLIGCDPEIDGEGPTYHYTAADKEKYEDQQYQRKLERDLRAYKRMAAGSVSPSDEALYKGLVKDKSKELQDWVDAHDSYLIRQREREKI